MADTIKHDLSKITYVKTTQSMTQEDLIEWVGKKEEIHGFIGWVEVEEKILDQTVPEIFPKYSIATDEKDKDGKYISRSKTWREYVCGVSRKSTNCGNVLIPVGYRNENRSRLSDVPSTELYLWIDQFGIDKIKTKSGGKELFVSKIKGR